MNRKFVVFLGISLISALFISCSKKVESTSDSISYNSSSQIEIARDYDIKTYSEEQGYEAERAAMDPEYEEKRIKIGNMDFETNEFDLSAQKIEDMVMQLGGYIESSSMNYYESTELRRKAYSIRIPSEHFDTVKGFIENIGNVTKSSVSESDVTQQYYDIVKRLEVREAEEKRLLELINEAEKLEDIILLEQRLSTVRTDIEIYKAQQQNIDRKVSYSTLYVNMYEIKDLYSAETLWGKIKKSFADSIKTVVEFFQEALVFLVAIFVPCVILLIVVLVARFIYKKLVKNRPKNLDKFKEKSENERKG